MIMFWGSDGTDDFRPMPIAGDHVTNVVAQLNQSRSSRFSFRFISLDFSPDIAQIKHSW